MTFSVNTPIRLGCPDPPRVSRFTPIDCISNFCIRALFTVAAEPEVDEEGYIRGLTSEEIMNLPDMPDEEDEETAGMTIDQITERANQMGGGGEGSQPLADGTYLVGDIAMTKEQYEEHMAEWKIQEA